MCEASSLAHVTVGRGSIGAASRAVESRSPGLLFSYIHTYRPCRISVVTVLDIVFSLGMCSVFPLRVYFTPSACRRIEERTFVFNFGYHALFCRCYFAVSSTPNACLP